ncbi:unnamed protein product [Prorocentrum cordatum]|uniref:rRNA-processing protein efg1 n=1 Tax=Prorocentrum cordatum TaxID=2364126 RepID=A0ABN9VEE1_9DINO|nr:unnamed protein product [Polarella glacialis]
MCYTDDNAVFHVDLSRKSVRDAKKELYTEYLLAQKKLDMIVLEKQKKDLREKSKCDSFIERCISIETQRASPFTFLGLDAEPDLELSGERLRPQLKVLYRKIVDQAAAKRQAQLDREQRHHEKQKKIAEEVAAKPPDQLLTMVIDDRINKSRLKEKQAKRPPGVPETPAAWYTRAAAFDLSSQDVMEDMAGMAKNGPAPAASGGRGRGRGNPAISGVRGRGRGRGRSTKGKGKSKSKGKGKDTDNNGGKNPKSKGKDQKGKGYDYYPSGGKADWGKSTQKSRGRGRGKSRTLGRGGRKNGGGW